MASDEIILTEEGKQKLEEELADREGRLHDEIVEKIKEARSFGDLSENSEYDDAKDEEAKNAARIAEIKATLARSRVVSSSDARRLVTDVELNTTVEVTDERGKTARYTIVSTTEVDSLEHKISNESPIGAALMGRHRGDEVSFLTPSGKKRKLTIVDISR